MGLSFAVKKNCRKNFQCRQERKNVIMVVYGKSDCGPCPTPPYEDEAYRSLNLSPGKILPLVTKTVS